MSVINAASADIDLTTSGAIADVAIGKDIVAFHLTQGFDLSSWEVQRKEPGPAFTAVGHVTAPGGEASVKGWTFGFLQIAKMHNGEAYYAGRTKSEGCVSAYFKNAMPTLVLLDSGVNYSPWTMPIADRFSVSGSTVTIKTQDHPALKVPRELRNSVKNVKNFLFNVVDNLEFWSVMTAVDPKHMDKFQHLFYFHWRVSHNVMFSWKDGNPVVTKKTSAFTLHGKDKGAPADAELQGLLKNPLLPLFNETAGEAMLDVFRGQPGVNRVEGDKWYTNVPANFWG